MTKTNAKTNNILAIETCTNICSIAILSEKNNKQILTEKVIYKDRSHSKELLPMIEEALIEANLTMQSIDLIACSQGPGSFTGVRIGVGVAKGLAYGQNIMIAGISPLAALAFDEMQNNSQAIEVTAIIDARMGELYYGKYKNNNGFPEIIGKETLTNLNKLDIDNSIFVGTGVTEYRNELIEKGANLSELEFPLAKNIAYLAKQFTENKFSSSEFKPVYLRNKIV